jgi:hypothetical protein
MLVVTRSLPASGSRGFRVRASAPHYGLSVTVPWDHALGSGGGVGSNHWAAAVALCRRFNASQFAAFAGAVEGLRFAGSAGDRGYGYMTEGAHVSEVFALDFGSVTV